MSDDNVPTLTIEGRLFKFPFRDQMRPLHSHEREALKASIQKHGIVDAIMHDEFDNVIDGDHRLQIAVEEQIDLHKIPFQLCAGLMLKEKRLMAVYVNDERRQQTAEEKAQAVQERRQRVAVGRQHGKSLRQLADENGVSHEQIRQDLKPAPESSADQSGSAVNPLTADATPSQSTSETREFDNKPPAANGQATHQTNGAVACDGDGNPLYTDEHSGEWINGRDGKRHPKKKGRKAKGDAWEGGKNLSAREDDKRLRKQAGDLLVKLVKVLDKLDIYQHHRAKLEQLRTDIISSPYCEVEELA